MAARAVVDIFAFGEVGVRPAAAVDGDMSVGVEVGVAEGDEVGEDVWVGVVVG